MSLFSNAHEVAVRYGRRVDEFHELFRRHGVGFGTAGDFVELGQRLEYQEEFRADFAMLTKSVQMEEEGRLTLRRMVSIVAIAMAGDELGDLRSSDVVPLEEFLLGVGGWCETETQIEAVEPVADAGGNEASRDAADEAREIRELEMLLGGQGRGDPVDLTAMFRDSEILREILNRPGSDLGDLKPHSASVEEETKRTEPGLSDFAARLESVIQGGGTKSDEGEEKDVSAAPLWLWDFRAPEVPAAAIVPEAAERKEPEFASFYKPPALIESEPGGSRARRRRLVVGTFAVVMLVPPVVVGLLVVRDYEGWLRRLPAGGPSKPTAMEVAAKKKAGPQRRGDDAVNATTASEPDMTSVVPPPAVTVWDGRNSGTGVIDGLKVVGDSGQGQIRLDQAGENPVIRIAAATSHPAKEEAAPVNAGTETRMPAGIPEPVTRAGATAEVKMARLETGPGLTGGVSGGGFGRPFMVMHPMVAVSPGMMGSYLVKSQLPQYPKSARRQGQQGDVLVRVLISEKGKIERVVVLSGPPALRGPVEKAVGRWRYKPYVENGDPVMVQTWMTFHFTLGPG